MLVILLKVVSEQEAMQVDEMLGGRRGELEAAVLMRANWMELSGQVDGRRPTFSQ